MKNNIKNLLDVKRMSINELSKLIEKDYPTTHALVNRENLGATQLDTLIKVAKALDVDIRLLYTDKAEEIEVINLLNKNYCGGLSTLALREYKIKAEKELKERLNRHVIIRYKYKSDIDMNGVEDELKLEIVVGDRKSEDDKYNFYFTTKSVQLIFTKYMMNNIIASIKEYEAGTSQKIEELYKGMIESDSYASMIDLDRIEVIEKDH